MPWICIFIATSLLLVLRFATLFLLFMGFGASAQPYYFRGEVKDESGKPLTGVAILQSGSGQLFHSGSTGGFGITSRKAVDTLVFSLEGYQKAQHQLRHGTPATIVLRRAGGSKSHNGSKLASITRGLDRSEQRRWASGNETYASTVENGWVAATPHPATGLSLHMDRASYSNLRRFIRQGVRPPPDAVRLEELLNYFPQGYTHPPPGKTFEVTATLQPTPWNPATHLLLTRIHARTLDVERLPSSHLTFLIDVSGSMDMPNRLPLLKGAFRALVQNLRIRDTVSIVVYGGVTAVMLQPTGGANKEKIFAAIDSLQPGGSTPGESGVRLAYWLARKHFIAGGNNRVILATDGDFNVGVRNEDELEELIEDQRGKGIYLTCLGVGMGNYKDSKIQTLATRGNGNFAYFDSHAEAEKVLLKEFTQTMYSVADDVHLELRFDAAAVRSYRLLGYDNLLGAIRDTASAIEGGEVGSASVITVAAELELTQAAKAGLPQGLQPVQVSLTWRAPADGRPGGHSFAPAVNDRPDSLSRFLGGVLLTGELLKESRLVKPGLWTQAEMAAAFASKNNPYEQEFLALLRLVREKWGKGRRK